MVTLFHHQQTANFHDERVKIVAEFQSAQPVRVQGYSDRQIVEGTHQAVPTFFLFLSRQELFNQKLILGLQLRTIKFLC